MTALRWNEAKLGLIGPSKKLRKLVLGQSLANSRPTKAFFQVHISDIACLSPVGYYFGKLIWAQF